MDEDDRKKLETFWRRKLWLGLAAVGAIGLAAWRVAVVQGRYDDVLVQESRELPEKVYQELVAEVRKGVPILPNPPNIDIYTDMDTSSLAGTRCDSILALGNLRDPRSIPELGKLLDDDMNRVRSCSNSAIFYSTSQGFSVYNSTILSLNQFKDAEAISYVKGEASKLPSLQVISIWRDFDRRSSAFHADLERDRVNDPYSYSNLFVKYDTQAIPVIENLQKETEKNKSMIQSLKDKAWSAEKKQEGTFESYVRRVLSYPLHLFPPEIQVYSAGGRNNEDIFIKNFSTPNQNSNNFVSPDLAIRLLQTSYVNERIVSIFNNDNSSPNMLSSLRSKLVDLKRGYPGKVEVLFDIFLSDVKNGRKIDPTDFKYISTGDANKYKELNKVLSNPNSKNKSSVAIALGITAKPGAVPALIEVLNNPDVSIRNTAAQLLGNLKDPSAAPALLKTLRSLPRTPISTTTNLKSMLTLPVETRKGIKVEENESSHAIFLHSLAQLGENSSVSISWSPQEVSLAVPILKKNLQKSSTTDSSIEDLKIRCQSTSLLLELGYDEGVENCLDHIRGFLKTEDGKSYVQKPQYQQLIGAPIVDNFFYSNSLLHTTLALVNGENTVAKIHPGKYATCSDRPSTAPLHALLLELLKNKDIETRRAAIFSLTFCGFVGATTNRRDIPHTLQAVKDSDFQIRVFATYHLINLRRNLTSRYHDEQIEQALIVLSKDEDSRIRLMAAVSLIAGKSKDSLPILITALRDPDIEIRRYSIKLLPYFSNYLKPSSYLDIRFGDGLRNLKLEIEPNLGEIDSEIRGMVTYLLNYGNISSEERHEILNNVNALKSSNDEVKKVAYEKINNLVTQQRTNDRRLASALITTLKSLNTSKDFPVEDWVQNLISNNETVLKHQNIGGETTRQHRYGQKFGLRERYQFRADLLESLELLIDRDSIDDTDKKSAISALMPIYKNWASPPSSTKPFRYSTSWGSPLEAMNRQYSQNPQRASLVRLIRKLNESQAIDRTAQLRTQQLFYLETGILGAIGVTAIGLLLSSIRLRNPFSLFFSTYLLFPEEVVAELIALKQRRQSEKVRKWQIRLELAYEIITLIWAFQIQIRIDDRKLPPGGNRSAK